MTGERDTLARLRLAPARVGTGRGWLGVAGLMAMTLAASPAGLAAALVGSQPAASVEAAPGVVRAASGGAVAEAPLPDGKGFWSVTAAGAVIPYGAAPYDGGTAEMALNAPILSISSTPDGAGYWLVAADGGIFSFGNAHFYGSTGNLHLHAPVVGMAPTPDGRGYWLVAADGGIFSFGNALFYGSTGNLHLDAPIVGMAPTPDGRGYWLVAADGGIFSFGDAHFYDSTGNLHLDAPIVGMAPTPDGRGYSLVAADGGMFSFGDAPFYGSAFGRLAGGSAVGIITTTGGYWIATTDGVLSFGAAPALSRLLHLPPTSSSKDSALAAATDPPASIPPSAAFAEACYRVTSTACDALALKAIDGARAGEGLPPLALPADFGSLDDAQQLVAVTNGERVARGLPPFAGPASGLDATALQAAEAKTDPIGPAGTGWASNWGYGFATPLAVDFVWMYDDGLGSNNLDCTPANQSGCWGHRHDILIPWGGTMGAAMIPVGAGNSISELFVNG